MLLNSKACQWTLVVLTLAVCPAFAADEAGPLARAQAKFREARYDEAAQLATAVIQQDTESTAAYRLRAVACEQLGKLDLAIADLSQVIKLQPDAADTIQHRGELHFQAGHIALSIEDFDRYLQARPDREPYHWQRGISYYYAGEYAKGVRQFEIHKTVNPHDVENAVWWDRHGNRPRFRYASAPRASLGSKWAQSDAQPGAGVFCGGRLGTRCCPTWAGRRGAA